MANQIVTDETVREFFNFLKTRLNNIGDLSGLKTTAKNNIVAAVNEILANAGTLSSLKTTAKDSIVNAINELVELTQILTYNNAYAHNSVYRGKNLGTALTAEQSAAIRNGTFKDIYPGDYWEAPIPAYTWTDWEGNVHEEAKSTYNAIWYVLGCNCLLHTTPHSTFNVAHIAVAPRYNLYQAKMNETATTEGGYVGSDMFTKHLKRAEAIVKAVFGEDHVLKHIDTFCNAVTDGVETGFVTLRDRVVDLMSEYMCFGHKIRCSASVGSYDHYAVTGYEQFPLFFYRPDLISDYGSMAWLREAIDSTRFAVLSTWGNFENQAANDPNNFVNVRPFFLLH